MDISAPALCAGFLFSTIGFSLFLYGKKQSRLPQLIAGVSMMALPILVPDALWICVSGVASIGALWLAVRAGN